MKNDLFTITIFLFVITFLAIVIEKDLRTINDNLKVLVALEIDKVK